MIKLIRQVKQKFESGFSKEYREMDEEINEQNRWEINKIGLLNFWWYDEEEFEFSNGRMILRGTNGSGKSVTID